MRLTPTQAELLADLRMDIEDLLGFQSQIMYSNSSRLLTITSIDLPKDLQTIQNVLLVK